MALKLDIQTSIDLPPDTEENIHKLLKAVPVEHLRGLEKIKIVDFIKPPQMKTNIPVRGDLPGLYHPKVGNKGAFLEVSAGALLQPTENFGKRWMARSQFKGNLAGMIFSLIGQHYYLTLRHSVKRQNIESQVRQYAEKNLKAWGEKQQVNNFRARLFKPLRPYMERWAKWLNKKPPKRRKEVNRVDRVCRVERVCDFN